MRKSSGSHVVGYWLFGLDIVVLLIIMIVEVLKASRGIDLGTFYNLLPEIVGINITVLIIDRALKARDEKIEFYREFESDIQTYFKFLMNIHNSVDTIVFLQEKNINNDILLIEKQKLINKIENAPIRKSFGNDKIKKEIKELIISSCSNVAITLEDLKSILSSDHTLTSEYKKINIKLFKVAFDILLLNKNKQKTQEIEIF